MKYKQIGFTLIEVMITITIIGVVAGIALTSISSIIKSSAKTTIIGKIKQNGDTIVEIMTRDARSANDACASTSGNISTLYLYNSTMPPGACDAINYAIAYECNASASGGSGSFQKTDKTVSPSVSLQLVDVQNVQVDLCTLSVVSSTSGPKVVTIDFRLKQGSSINGNFGDPVGIQFKTLVSLRTFSN